MFVCISDICEHTKYGRYELILILKAYACSYVTFYMPYAMLYLYVIRYVYYMTMC